MKRLALLLAGLLAAGCIGGAGPQEIDAASVVPTDPVAYPLQLDHDHADPSLHAAASRIDLVASMPVTFAGFPTASGGLALGGDALLLIADPPTTAVDPTGLTSLSVLGRSVVVVDTSNVDAPRVASTSTCRA